MSYLPARARILGASVASILLVSALAGCSVLDGIFPAEAERDSTTNKIAEAGTQDVFTVAVGDCYNNDEAESDEVTDLPAVPCTDAHDNEIYYLFDLPGDDFPTDIDSLADSGCGVQFTAFAGIEQSLSASLDYYPIQPTIDTWGEGDREVICSIYDVTGKSTGTLAGAAR